MKIEVLYSRYGLGNEVVLDGGSQEIAVTSENAPLLAGGEAAGALLIVDASDDERALLVGHVQSQEDGEAEYERSQAEGRWQEGQAIQADLDEQARIEGEEG